MPVSPLQLITGPQEVFVDFPVIRIWNAALPYFFKIMTVMVITYFNFNAEDMLSRYFDKHLQGGSAAREDFSYGS